MSTTLVAALLALVGVLAVIAVSYAFYVIGRAEDRDRAAAAKPPPPERETRRPGADHQAPGLARERRRPLPPRRPQR